MKNSKFLNLLIWCFCIFNTSNAMRHDHLLYNPANIDPVVDTDLIITQEGCTTVANMVSGWTDSEKNQLMNVTNDYLESHWLPNWDEITYAIPGKTAKQCYNMFTIMNINQPYIWRDEQDADLWSRLKYIQYNMQQQKMTLQEAWKFLTRGFDGIPVKVMKKHIADLIEQQYVPVLIKKRLYRTHLVADSEPKQDFSMIKIMLETLDSVLDNF